MSAMGETRWLSDDEIKAWRPLAALALLLPPRLEESLQAHGLTFFEYSVLVVLADAQDRTAPMSELAHLAGGSLSRTSHSARRLEQRGVLQRSQCPTDRRVTLVSLTDEGQQLLVEAAPNHVEAVRSVIFDVLTPSQAKELGQHVTTILTNLAPTGPWAADTSNGAPRGNAAR